MSASTKDTDKTIPDNLVQMTHLLLSLLHTKSYVYGGFVRDCIVLGLDSFNDVDLFLVETPSEFEEKLQPFFLVHKKQCKLESVSFVVACKMNVELTLSLDVVFGEINDVPDFDVNMLRYCHGKVELRRENLNLDLEQVVQHVRNRQFQILNMEQTYYLKRRVKKMMKKGWVCINPIEWKI